MWWTHFFSKGSSFFIINGSIWSSSLVFTWLFWVARDLIISNNSHLGRYEFFLFFFRNDIKQGSFGIEELSSPTFNFVPNCVLCYFSFVVIILQLRIEDVLYIFRSFSYTVGLCIWEVRTLAESTHWHKRIQLQYRIYVSLHDSIIKGSFLVLQKYGRKDRKTWQFVSIVQIIGTFQAFPPLQINLDNAHQPCKKLALVVNIDMLRDILSERVFVREIHGLVYLQFAFWVLYSIFPLGVILAQRTNRRLLKWQESLQTLRYIFWQLKY